MALFLLPTAYGVIVPSTVMWHVSGLVDPERTVLWGDEATPENARRTIIEENPNYVFTTGHGLPCITTLQDKAPFLSVENDGIYRQTGYCRHDLNADLVRGRVWHVHSCWCGLQLADWMVKNGARAVFAHSAEFMFLMPEGYIDITTASPFLSEFAADTHMLAGSTAGKAQEARLRAYDTYINYFYSGPGKNLRGAGLVLRLLIADRSIAVLKGDPSATVTPTWTGGPVKLQLPVPLGRGEVEAEGPAQVSPAVVLGALGVVLMALSGRWRR